MLQPGHRHASLLFEHLRDTGRVRTRPGDRCRPQRGAGAKASANRRMRRGLRPHHIRRSRPRKADERQRGPFNKPLYKLRAQVEQLSNRLTQFRRIAPRYEKRGDNYLGMVTLGALLLYV